MNAAEQRQYSWEQGAKVLPHTMTTGHIQKLFGVSQHTVLKWHALGELEADKPPVAGTREAHRYPRNRVLDFARQNHLELNLEAIGLQTADAQ